ncbi:hypothetical protein CONLIGDRAFT_687752 [Coniochaeta ligniaria NRRL 30616]|uniref:Uncharacterized protein n=1 Tax=Coniochaeta ligniaria NRRL 30616 TaxID=1408157 RepID=A0A1J7IM65_9PEZI|nr:hypothetical protein CONLIGDRAFT_687752 [Coniochaeta ligniaria NRRL 30616]
MPNPNLHTYLHQPPQDQEGNQQRDTTEDKHPRCSNRNTTPHPASPNANTALNASDLLIMDMAHPRRVVTHRLIGFSARSKKPTKNRGPLPPPSSDRCCAACGMTGGEVGAVR